MRSYLTLREPRTVISKKSIASRALLVLVIVSFLLLASVYAIRFVTIHRLEQQVAVLSEKEQVALSEQAALRARLAMKDDPQAIEDVAREKLGLVKPGEQLIIFVKGD